MHRTGLQQKLSAKPVCTVALVASGTHPQFVALIWPPGRSKPLPPAIRHGLLTCHQRSSAKKKLQSTFRRHLLPPLRPSSLRSIWRPVRPRKYLQGKQHHIIQSLKGQRPGRASEPSEPGRWPGGRMQDERSNEMLSLTVPESTAAETESSWLTVQACRLHNILLCILRSHVIAH